MAYAGRVLWIVQRVQYLIKESKHPGDTVLATEIVPLINACGKLLASRRLLKTSVALDITADQNVIAYPADYMELKEAFWAEDHIPLENVGDRSKFYNLNQLGTEGARIYAVHPAAENLMVWPTPTATTTGAIDALYYQNWTDVTETDPPDAVGSVTGVTVANAGTGYSEDDVLTLPAPDGGEVATCTVTGVTDGVIDGIEITTAGKGYSLDTYPTVVMPAGGTGATIEITDMGSGVVDPITPPNFDMLFVYYCLREIFRTKRGGKASAGLAKMYDADYQQEEQRLLRWDRGSRSANLDR